MDKTISIHYENLKDVRFLTILANMLTVRVVRESHALLDCS